MTFLYPLYLHKFVLFMVLLEAFKNDTNSLHCVQAYIQL